MKRLIAIFLSIPIFSFALNCQNAETSLKMRQCASKQFKAADTTLNHQYQKMMTLVNPKQKAILKQAQRAWLKYRDGHCQLMALKYEGGSLAPVVQINCMVYLTNLRNKTLKDALDEYQMH